MAQDSLITLYSQKLIGLAANMPDLRPLEHADADVKRRAPLCGSHVTVSLKVNNGRISEFYQDVKACALGQASASVFGANALGLSVEEVKGLRDQMVDMLKHNGEAPKGAFDELKYLEAAKDFTNRHESILLVFNATLDAMEQAQKKASA
ncbi:MAG: iron-sulfur cluster assembly scaffold protein [Pseudomonadota bacterium]